MVKWEVILQRLLLYFKIIFFFFFFFYLNQNSTNFEMKEENVLFWMVKGTKITFSTKLQVRGRDSRIQWLELLRETYFLLEKVWNLFFTRKLQLYLAYLAWKTTLIWPKGQAVDQFLRKSQKFSAGALFKVSFSSLRKWPILRQLLQILPLGEWSDGW